jgi:hypothetical protein
MTQESGFLSLVDRLALTRRLLAAVWLGRGGQEPLDGRLEALLRERLGLLVLRLGHEASVAEPPVDPSQGMIAAGVDAFLDLDGSAGAAEIAEEVYRAMAAAASSSRHA